MREIGEAGHSRVSQSTRLDSLPLNIELHHIAAMAVPPSLSLSFLPARIPPTGAKYYKRERERESVCVRIEEGQERRVP